jgi:hypothetical protein
MLDDKFNDRTSKLSLPNRIYPAMVDLYNPGFGSLTNCGFSPAWQRQ